MLGFNHVEFEKNNAVVLNTNKMLKTHGNHNKKTITCLQGKIWVTQEGDLQDHVLSAGDKMITSKNGVVLIQALDNASIQVETSEPKPLLH
jgi:quercetin dioxygenase-like cupin family protein